MKNKEKQIDNLYKLQYTSIFLGSAVIDLKERKRKSVGQSSSIPFFI